MVESNYFSKKQAGRTAKLGDELAVLMDSKITPQQERNCSIYEIWQQLLPSELSKHCRIDSVSNGQLKVLVDSSSYMYQLQLCREVLLAELKSQCPRLRIATLKFAVG